MNRVKKVYLYKIGRFQEDFEYIFPEIKVVKYITDKENYMYNSKECIRLKEMEKKPKHLIVICDRKNKEITNKFKKLGLQERKNYIYLEDFAERLNDTPTRKEKAEFKNYESVFSNEMKRNVPSNSDLFKRMMYTDAKYSLNCCQPFRFVQIQSDGSVYPCCGDTWATENIGNIYYHDGKKIWNSTRSRIFRLSIVNKTYAFCDLNNCPHEIEKFNPDEPRANNFSYTDQPLEVYVAFDNTCNLKCKSCRTCFLSFNDDPKRQMMYDKIIKKLLKNNWLNKSETLAMSSSGEVLYSNAYKNILFSDKLKRDSVIIHTNGTLLNQKNIDKLCNQFKDLSFYISVDSIVDETYEDIRFGGSMKALKNNLKLLSKAKAEGKVNFVHILCVLQKSNYKELPKLAEFVRDLKFDALDVSQISNWGTYTDEEFKEISMYDQKGNPKPELLEVLKDPIFESNEIKFIGNVINKIKNQETKKTNK